MKDFTTEIGKKRVIINTASLREVQNLKKVIFNEFKKSPIGIKLIGGPDSLFDKEIDFTGIIDFIKNTLIGIETSPEFEEAIFACLKHCTYNNVYKIDEALFDNETVPEARDDYYEIIYACIEENLRPFILGLVAMWKTHIQSGKLLQALNTWGLIS